MKLTAKKKKNIRNRSGKRTDVAKALYEDDKANAWMMQQGTMKKAKETNAELDNGTRKQMKAE